MHVQDGALNRVEKNGIYGSAVFSKYFIGVHRAKSDEIVAGKNADPVEPGFGFFRRYSLIGKALNA